MRRNDLSDGSIKTLLILVLLVANIALRRHVAPIDGQGRGLPEPSPKTVQESRAARR